MILCFSRTMTPNIPEKKPNNGNIMVLKQPTQSPDLNPMENLWHHLKKELGEYEEPAESVTELWDRVQVEWEKILMEDVKNAWKHA